MFRRQLAARLHLATPRVRTYTTLKERVKRLVADALTEIGLIPRLPKPPPPLRIPDRKEAERLQKSLLRMSLSVTPEPVPAKSVEATVSADAAAKSQVAASSKAGENTELPMRTGKVAPTSEQDFRSVLVATIDAMVAETATVHETSIECTATKSRIPPSPSTSHTTAASMIDPDTLAYTYTAHLDSSSLEQMDATATVTDNDVVEGEKDHTSSAHEPSSVFWKRRPGISETYSDAKATVEVSGISMYMTRDDEKTLDDWNGTKHVSNRLATEQRGQSDAENPELHSNAGQDETDATTSAPHDATPEDVSQVQKGKDDAEGSYQTSGHQNVLDTDVRNPGQQHSDADEPQEGTDTKLSETSECISHGDRIRGLIGGLEKQIWRPAEASALKSDVVSTSDPPTLLDTLDAVYRPHTASEKQTMHKKPRSRRQRRKRDKYGVVSGTAGVRSGPRLGADYNTVSNRVLSANEILLRHKGVNDLYMAFNSNKLPAYPWTQYNIADAIATAHHISGVEALLNANWRKLTRANAMKVLCSVSSAPGLTDTLDGRETERARPVMSKRGIDQQFGINHFDAMPLRPWEFDSYLTRLISGIGFTELMQVVFHGAIIRKNEDLARRFTHVAKFGYLGVGRYENLDRALSEVTLRIYSDGDVRLHHVAQIMHAAHRIFGRAHCGPLRAIVHHQYDLHSPAALKHLDLHTLTLLLNVYGGPEFKTHPTQRHVRMSKFRRSAWLQRRARERGEWVGGEENTTICKHRKTALTGDKQDQEQTGTLPEEDIDWEYYTDTKGQRGRRKQPNVQEEGSLVTGAQTTENTKVSGTMTSQDEPLPRSDWDLYMEEVQGKKKRKEPATQKQASLKQIDSDVYEYFGSGKRPSSYQEGHVHRCNKRRACDTRPRTSGRPTVKRGDMSNRHVYMQHDDRDHHATVRELRRKRIYMQNGTRRSRYLNIRSLVRRTGWCECGYDFDYNYTWPKALKRTKNNLMWAVHESLVGLLHRVDSRGATDREEMEEMEVLSALHCVPHVLECLPFYQKEDKYFARAALQHCANLMTQTSAVSLELFLREEADLVFKRFCGMLDGVSPMDNVDELVACMKTLMWNLERALPSSEYYLKVSQLGIIEAALEATMSRHMEQNIDTDKTNRLELLLEMEYCLERIRHALSSQRELEKFWQYPTTSRHHDR